MMYRNNFVAVIKNKGRVLREDHEGVVRLPFGSEYTIALKNKDSRLAVVNVEIDDRDVATGVIVPANTTVELKGSIEGLKVNNRFRFIQKTKEIQDYRGDRLGDGLVRVEYRFEKWQDEPVYVQPPTWPIRPCEPIKWTYTGDNTGGAHPDWTYYNSDQTASPRGRMEGSFGGITTQNCSYTGPESDEGITVKGSKTRQDFQYGSVGTLESNSSVIILHLRGATTTRKRVKKPLLVKTKLTCSTCGRRSRSSAKFCPNCGTYLE